MDDVEVRDGVPERQAKAWVRFENAFASLATKEDLAYLRQHLDTELAGVRADIGRTNADVGSLRWAITIVFPTAALVIGVLTFLLGKTL